MRLKVGDVHFLLALFQQMEADAYKPVNRITGYPMTPGIVKLRDRLEASVPVRTNDYDDIR